MTAAKRGERQNVSFGHAPLGQSCCRATRVNIVIEAVRSGVAHIDEAPPVHQAGGLDEPAFVLQDAARDIEDGIAPQDNGFPGPHPDITARG